MISPQDLIKACQEFESLQLNYKIRSFDSGSKFIQSSAFSEDKMAQKILGIVGKSPKGLSAVGLSNAERMSVVLAKEELLVCILNLWDLINAAHGT